MKFIEKWDSETINLGIKKNELESNENIKNSLTIVIIATKNHSKIQPSVQTVAIDPKDESLRIIISRELAFDKVSLSPDIILRVVPEPVDSEQVAVNKDIAVVIIVTSTKKVI